MVPFLTCYKLTTKHLTFPNAKANQPFQYTRHHVQPRIPRYSKFTLSPIPNRCYSCRSSISLQSSTIPFAERIPADNHCIRSCGPFTFTTHCPFVLIRISNPNHFAKLSSSLSCKGSQSPARLCTSITTVSF
jgi:hypothetical protein